MSIISVSDKHILNLIPCSNSSGDPCLSRKPHNQSPINCALAIQSHIPLYSIPGTLVRLDPLKFHDLRGRRQFRLRITHQRIQWPIPSRQQPLRVQSLGHEQFTAINSHRRPLPVSTSDNIPNLHGIFGKTETGQGRSCWCSGFWSDVSSTPSIPKSELASHELGRCHPEGSSANGP
jgi:hypothetical protein